MSIAVIAYDVNTRYDPVNPTRVGAMTGPDDHADLERRVEAGEWLTPGAAARFLGVGRTKVHKLLGDGTIGYRVKPGSRHRVCNPADLRKLRDEYDREHRPSVDPPPER